MDWAWFIHLHAHAGRYVYEDRDRQDEGPGVILLAGRLEINVSRIVNMPVSRGFTVTCVAL